MDEPMRSEGGGGRSEDEALFSPHSHSHTQTLNFWDPPSPCSEISGLLLSVFYTLSFWDLGGVCGEWLTRGRRWDWFSKPVWVGD